MAFEMPLEKWAASVTEATIGATAADGGTRASTVVVGGETTLPFLGFEGATPHRPVLAMEVCDLPLVDPAAPLAAALGDVMSDPAAWAKKCVEDWGADLISLRLLGAEPEGANKSPDECAAVVKAVLGAVGVPLLIWGCTDDAKNNDILPAVSQAGAGERCVLASATKDNYRTIAACAIADGHLVLSEAPLDIAIQKQVNIQLTDMNVPADRIIQYQTTGGLGYGIEYAYSIMERTRLAALGGDKMMQMPTLAMVGRETWKVKESRLPATEAPQWGEAEPRAILWEASTATLLIHAGVDILVLWHPEAVRIARETIQELAGEGA